MNAAVHPGYINLLNPELAPVKKSFSGRSVAGLAVIALVAILLLGWWAVVEKRSVSQQLNERLARRAAEAARGEEIAGTPQQIAALEKALQAKEGLLESRRAARAQLRRGVAAEGGGPSLTLRTVAATIPAEVWIVGLTAHGDRLEITGRTLDPAALAAWMTRLGETKYFAAKPISSMQVENVAPTERRGNLYTFTLTAQLALPFADEGTGP